MCLMRKYYGTCEVTLEQRHEAFKQVYGPKLLDGTWDREMFIKGFPRDRAQMTLEEVEAFADGLTASV